MAIGALYFHKEEKYVDDESNDRCIKVYTVVANIINVLVAFTFIIVGAIYTNDCPLEKMIPIFLIVQGWLMLFNVTLNLLMKRLKGNSGRTSCPLKMLSNLVSVALISWVISGNVWVFRAWTRGPNFDEHWKENGCHSTVFYVAFGGIIFFYCCLAIQIASYFCTAFIDFCWECCCTAMDIF